ncbi:B-cell receptor CD22-like [Mytilus californianus]|uniref:B-cell receptor CD22-like n=1 Tax=Mytilus californianus TaxID=6549 RepID=UPI0022455B14|nr:B-cell receptor CD22-like [Mytilus californianus]
MATPFDDNPVEIVTGKTQQFQCKTDAGRPSSRIQWYMSGTNITSLATPQDVICSLNCNGKVISSSVLTYTGNRGDEGKIMYCTALNIENQSVGSQNKTVEILYGASSVIISPTLQIYTVKETIEGVGPINCTADDCNPDCAMTWSRPTMSDGYISVLNLQKINRTQAGNYSCNASNTAWSKTSVAVNVIVQYGPAVVNISPPNQTYTIKELTGSAGHIICNADCKPDCIITWKGNNVPVGTNNILYLTNITRKQAGNYQCTATNNVGNNTSVTVIVIVLYYRNINFQYQD